MSLSSGAYQGSRPYDQRLLKRKGRAQSWIAASALAFVATTSAWTIYSFVPGESANALAFADRFAPLDELNLRAPEAGFSVAPPKTIAATASKSTTTIAVKKVAKADPIAAPQIPREVREGYASLMDPTRRFGSQPGTFVTASALAADDQSLTGSLADPSKQTAKLPDVVRQVAHNVPLPSVRPSAIRAAAQGPGPSPKEIVQANKATGFELARREAASIFDKIFGNKPSSGTQLAYASPDGGVFSDGREKPSSQGSIDRFTAIYDISARTVYMPDGSKLEAHSGLGPKMDDPRHVHVKMHGATPPHVYELTPREALFHGVQAIRMTPVGGPGAIHGRTGILAHTYMLGPRGDSNGCVSFRDYNAFLQAYKRGEVKRMVVVASGAEKSIAMR